MNYDPSCNTFIETSSKNFSFSFFFLYFKTFFFFLENPFTASYSHTSSAYYMFQRQLAHERVHINYYSAGNFLVPAVRTILSAEIVIHDNR